MGFNASTKMRYSFQTNQDESLQKIYHKSMNFPILSSLPDFNQIKLKSEWKRFLNSGKFGCVYQLRKRLAQETCLRGIHCTSGGFCCLVTNTIHCHCLLFGTEQGKRHVENFCQMHVIIYWSLRFMHGQNFHI